MKKVLSFLLILTLVLPLFACGETTPTDAPETETVETSTEASGPRDLTGKTIGELTDEEFTKALQAVAYAFYYKNPYCQYEAFYYSKDGELIRTPGQTPEDTASDSMHFSQCSEFIWDVYMELCGYDFVGNYKGFKQIRNKPYSDSIILSWEKGQTEPTQEALIEQLKALAQPGDVFYGDSSNGNGGHVMMFLGDIKNDGQMYMMHCWPLDGENLQEDGTQKLEPNGSIVIQPAERLIYSAKGEPNWGITTPSCGKEWLLCRPRILEDCQKCVLSDATVSRLKYDGISIEKTAELDVYHDLKKGQDLTIFETVRNNGTAGFENVKLTEYVPEGATLKQADEQAQVNGKELTWTLNVPRGGSVTVSYTITNELEKGNTLTIPRGLCDHIPTRTMTYQIGASDLTESQLAILEQIRTGQIPESIKNLEEFQDLNFVNIFYKEVLGIEGVNLPDTVNDYLKKQFQTKSASFQEGAKVLRLKDLKEEDAYLGEMVLQKHIGGQYFTINTLKDFTHRTPCIIESYYKPGDVFVSYGDVANTVQVFLKDYVYFDIYLGDGIVLEYSNTGCKKTAFSTSIGRMLGKNFFVCFRPTLVLDSQ